MRHILLSQRVSVCMFFSFFVVGCVYIINEENAIKDSAKMPRIMSGVMLLELPDLYADRQRVLRRYITYLKTMKRESGIYGVCKQPVMPMLYTDMIEALLNPEESERLPFLVVSENFAYRLQLIPADNKCGKDKTDKQFLLKYTEVRHTEKSMKVQENRKRTREA